MSKPNKIRIQLESALRDAEAAATADISTQKLIQTRLTILNKIAGRLHNAKIRKLKQQLAQYQTENARLKDEISRLAQGQASDPTHPIATEINEMLRKYGTDKGGTNDVL